MSHWTLSAAALQRRLAFAQLNACYVFTLTSDGVERVVSAEEFARAEAAAGLHPKPGCGPLATCGFCSSEGISGSYAVLGYTCECERDGEGPKPVYRVIDHDGSRTLVRYCEDCAELARMDWNGETKALEGPFPEEISDGR